MNYYLIGSGRMANFLAGRLTQAGHTCSGLYARNFPEAKRICETFHLPQIIDPNQILDGADACILAVSDYAIAEVSAQFRFSSTTVVHTSGTTSMDVLSVPNRAVVWPVYSLGQHGAALHRNFSTVWEANSTQARLVADLLSRGISDTTAEVGSEARKLLHLAAVVGNNFVNHLLFITGEICTQAGLDMQLLLPLLMQTLSPERAMQAGNFQSGPALRRDENTIAAHEQLLAQTPHWREVYTSITKSIQAAYPLPNL